jgi:hypothetical protein
MIVQKIPLLIFACARACVNGSAHDILKYNLNKFEQKQLFELLLDIGY